MEGNVIVIGDFQQVADYVQSVQQINHRLQEINKVNQQLVEAFAKLQADIDARNAADKTKDQQIADLTAQNADLSNQINTLTAADQTTTQSVLDAVNQADNSVVSPPQ